MVSRDRLARRFRALRDRDAFVSLRIALAYLLFGALWILASDRVLASLVSDPSRLSWLQTFKGWGFVAGTSLFLFVLVWVSIRGLRELRDERKESERFLRTLLHNLPGAVYVCSNDPEWTMTYLSDDVKALTGYAAVDLLHNESLSYASLIHEDDRDRVWQEVQRAVETRRAFRLEYRIRTRSGETRWVWEQGRGVFDEDGELIQLEGFLTDVTDRRNARQEIRRQVERLRALRAIDLAIMGSLDLRVTMEVVLDQLTAQLSVDAAAVLAFDARSERLEYAGSRGFRTEALQHASLRLGEGHAGRAALERETLRVADLRRQPGELLRSWLLPEEEFVAYFAVPLVSQGQLRGVLEVFHRERLEPDAAWLEFLETLAGQTAIAIDNARLFEELEQKNLELRVAYDQTIEGWARALDLRDDETEGHSRRVAGLTVALAERMGVRGEELVQIRRGALLHDIGKLGVPDRILLKPGPLTAEEWEVMRKHPGYARDLLAPVPFLQRALDIPYCHHEKWDGSGYPRGLVGVDIPLPARIFAVVDVWDALRSDRPYRTAWPEERAREHIREQAGRHFDPEVVAVFLAIDSGELSRMELREPAATGERRSLPRTAHLLTNI